jgi:GT2 family glycosyltransferase
MRGDAKCKRNGGEYLLASSGAKKLFKSITSFLERAEGVDRSQQSAVVKRHRDRSNLQRRVKLFDEPHQVGEMSSALSISVMVPTYRRPQDLQRCLHALAQQSRRADEVLVVVRDTDTETWNALERIDMTNLPLRTVTATEPGLVSAMNVGLAQVRTELVAITDDDAAPHADWIQRIVAMFDARPEVGGVGGRDYMHIGGVLQDGRERIVGKVPAIGKHIGNHHLGYGAAREVDMLKGVNGAYRTEAVKRIGFDTRLRGSGAQIHWEISLGLALRRAGWKLIYDPQIAVDHYLAQRFDEDQRDAFNALAMQNAAYNEAIIRMEYLTPLARVAFVGWAVLVGTRVLPGLAQWVRFFPRQGSLAGAKFAATFTGRLHAWNDTWAAKSARLRSSNS